MAFEIPILGPFLLKKSSFWMFAICVLVCLPILIPGCLKSSPSDPARITLADQDISFTDSSFACYWEQINLRWRCSEILDGGRVIRPHFLYSRPDYSGNVSFVASGTTVHKLSDLVGHEWSGRGDIIRRVSRGSFDWISRSALTFQVLSFDVATKTIRFQFNGKIDYLTATHPRGELYDVRGEVVTKVKLDFTRGALTTDDAPHDPYFDFKTLENLAEHNDLKAQLLVGQAYMSGVTVPKSLDNAFRWWRKAAESGDAEAQAYYSLKFWPQDPVRAYMWNYLAANGGYAEGRDSCLHLAQEMTSDQLHEAIRLASTWKPGTSESSEPVTIPDVQELQKRIDSGDAEAEFALSEDYRYGRGVPKDSFKWISLAAAAEHDGSKTVEYSEFMSTHNTQQMKQLILLVWAHAKNELRFIRAFFRFTVARVKVSRHVPGADAQLYVARLLSPNRGISSGAIRDLTQLSLPEKRALVPYLTDALWDIDEEISQKAFSVLRWIAPQTPEMVDQVIKALKPPRFWRPRLRTERIQQILFRMGPPAERALQSLANAENSDMAPVAKSTLQGFALYKDDKIGQEIESKLYSPATGLSDSYSWYQTEFIVLPSIFAQLRDPNRIKRIDAIRTLGDFGFNAHQEVPSIAECLINKDPNQCHGTLYEIKELDQWRQRSISQLAILLRSADPTLKQQTILALQKFNTPESVAALVNAH